MPPTAPALVWTLCDPAGRIPGAPGLFDHADCPRGLAHLLRHLLAQGEPAVACLPGPDGTLCLTALFPLEGRVLALSVPAKGPLHRAFAALYPPLLRIEAERNLPPEAAAALLLRRLSDLGHSGAEAAMAALLTDEMPHLAAGQGRAPDRAPDRATVALSALSVHLGQALDEQACLVQRFADLLLLPVNMRLVAARLEPQGGPLSQISVNYKTASEDIARRLSGVVSGKAGLCAQLARSLRRSVLLSGLTALVDAAAAPSDQTAQLPVAMMTEGLRGQAETSMVQAAHLAARLNETSTDLRRMILGLDTIRILARVESRKTSQGAEALTATIDRIDQVQAAISESLKVMSDRTGLIQASLDTLLRRSRRSARAA